MNGCASDERQTQSCCSMCACCTTRRPQTTLMIKYGLRVSCDASRGAWSAAPASIIEAGSSDGSKSSSTSSRCFPDGILGAPRADRGCVTEARSCSRISAWQRFSLSNSQSEPQLTCYFLYAGYDTRRLRAALGPYRALSMAYEAFLIHHFPLLRRIPDLLLA